MSSVLWNSVLISTRGGGVQPDGVLWQGLGGRSMLNGTFRNVELPSVARTLDQTTGHLTHSAAECVQVELQTVNIPHCGCVITT